MSTSNPAPQTLTYVSGSTDAEQQLDLYLPTSQATSLIVFIHGGAWRTGSRKDHVDLAQYLCSKGKAVAVIDYRLSVKDEGTGLPKHIHPVHAQDVNAALRFLHARSDVPKDWTVVGHSIGAWLTLAAIIDGEPRSGNAEYPKPMPMPDSAAREAVKTCVLVVSSILHCSILFVRRSPTFQPSNRTESTQSHHCSKNTPTMKASSHRPSYLNLVRATTTSSLVRFGRSRWRARTCTSGIRETTNCCRSSRAWMLFCTSISNCRV